MPPDNENWTKCAKCGSPVLIDPTTGQPEACSNCEAGKSPGWLALGGLFIAAGIGGVAYLVYLGIKLLAVE